MEFTVTVSEDRRYTIITGRGELREMDQKAVVIAFREAYALAGQLKINRCLVDQRNAPNAQSPGEDYDLIYRRLGEDPFLHQAMLVVLLVAPNDHSYDFVETAARNAGFLVHLFRDLQKALEVLQG